MKIAVQEKTAGRMVYSSGMATISWITKVSITLLLVFTVNLLLAQQPNQEPSRNEQIDKETKQVTETAQSTDKFNAMEKRLEALEKTTNDLNDLSTRVDELKKETVVLESYTGISEHIVNQSEINPPISLLDLISSFQNDLNDKESRLNSFSKELRAKIKQVKRDSDRGEGILLGLGVFVIVFLFLTKNNKPKHCSCESYSTDGLINFDNDLLAFPMIELIHENRITADIFITYVTSYITMIFEDIKRITVKNKIKYPANKIAVGTTKGNVRSENQDFCMAFETKRFQLMIMADGLGGVSHGREAAQIASASAALSILKRLCILKKIKDCDAEMAVRNSFESASKNLDNISDMLGVKNPNQGFRTTLIIVLALPSHYIWGYIGDGGLVILRATGQQECLLIPQKADPQSPNILAASLGPIIEGSAIFGITAHHPGDLVLCGTDGIFDRVSSTTFSPDILRAVIEHNGDLDKVVHLILEELSGSKDEFGYVCDDNMSLGLIRDDTLAKLFLQKKPTKSILK
jgi:serine/threonine protein phosphatase PrpC/tetrahydromethanopterin S-methyltransferase subunit G